MRVFFRSVLDISVRDIAALVVLGLFIDAVLAWCAFGERIVLAWRAGAL